VNKKNLGAISVIICFSFFLCGCSLNIVPVSHTNEYIVTALGFDCQEEILKVTAETLIVSTEQASEQANTKIFFAEAEKIPAAMEKISEKATQSLEMSHCAVAIIGESVTPHYMKEICDYFYKTQGLTLSAFFVATENAEKLLSQKAVSSVAVGYDIVSILEKQGNHSGTKFKNRYFEIEAARKSKTCTFALPLIKTEGEDIIYNGAVVYSNLKSALTLKDEQLFFYALANDIQGKGTVFLNGKEIKINSAYTSYKTKKEGQKVKITANISIDTKQNDILTSKTVENEIKKLFLLSQQTKIDILKIGDLLYHREKSFFTENKDFYEKVEYSVNINEE